ncbi:hypothetical protein Hanom_Chr02g00155751 [Helianthus anomalus]
MILRKRLLRMKKGQGIILFHLPLGKVIARKKLGVENALNIKLKSVQNQVDQLPDEIDVTYTKSDVCESELVNDVVEKVFEDESQSDSTKNENSKSQLEDGEIFHKNYL